LPLANANTYLGDVYFTVPDSVYMTNEGIEMKGYVYQTIFDENDSLITNSSVLANATVNLTITSSGGGGGGGGGGGSSSGVSESGGSGINYDLGELNSEQSVEATVGDRIRFKINGSSQSVYVSAVSEAQITLDSSNFGQIVLSAGKEQNTNLITGAHVELKSVNIITKKAKLIFNLA